MTPGRPADTFPRSRPPSTRTSESRIEMNWILLLTDLIPVLIFVVLDSRGQVKHAVIAAVGAAAVEIAFSYLFLGGMDEFSLAYVALFLLFGGLSYRFNNSLFFKFKPVAISGASVLTTTTRADGFVIVPEDSEGYAAQTQVQVRLY